MVVDCAISTNQQYHPLTLGNWRYCRWTCVSKCEFFVSKCLMELCSSLSPRYYYAWLYAFSSSTFPYYRAVNGEEKVCDVGEELGELDCMRVRLWPFHYQCREYL